MKSSEADLRQMDEQRVEALAEDELRPTISRLLIIIKEQYDQINMTPQGGVRPSADMAQWERSNAPDAKPSPQPEPDPARLRKNAQPT